MRGRFDIKVWAGGGISLFFLVLLFRKIDFRQLWTALLAVDGRYLAGAVALTFVSYFMRAVRWRFLLIQEKEIPLASLYPATVIGYMANNLLPARIGEVIRACTLASREQLPVPTVFASLVIDRLCDGFTVMLMLSATLVTLEFPPAMRDAETAVRTGGVVMFAAYAGIVLFLILLKRMTSRMLKLIAALLRPFPASWAERVIPALGSFIGGIRMSSRPSHVGGVIWSSLLIWMSATIPIDLVLRAFGIHLPISASMFIMVLLVFAVMIPASPGYIGTYHYACFKGLSVFGVSGEQAMGIALIIHGIGFFPVIVAGLYHLWRGRISLSDVRAAGETA